MLTRRNGERHERQDTTESRGIADALNDVEPTAEEIASAVAELPITPAAWAAQVRARALAAQETARQGKLQVDYHGSGREPTRITLIALVMLGVVAAAVIGGAP